jgi:hypothetical protein
MSRKIAARVVAGVILFGAGSAFAQESNLRPGNVGQMCMPAGAACSGSEQDFQSVDNSGSGPALNFNLTCVDGIEGEVGSIVPITPGLQFGDLNHNVDAAQGSVEEAKAGTPRRLFVAALTKIVEFFAGGMSAGGR